MHVMDVIERWVGVYSQVSSKASTILSDGVTVRTAVVVSMLHWEASRAWPFRVTLEGTDWFLPTILIASMGSEEALPEVGVRLVEAHLVPPALRDVGRVDA